MKWREDARAVANTCLVRHAWLRSKCKPVRYEIQVLLYVRGKYKYLGTYGIGRAGSPVACVPCCAICAANPAEANV
jgi:hypothetical protein